MDCTFIIFHIFQCFLPYSKSYHVRFSFSYFLSFFSPYYRSYSLGVSFFTFPSISSHIPGPTIFVSHFTRLSVFSTYSRHNSACVSFLSFYRFLALFQVLVFTFLIFHVFAYFSKYFRSYNVSHFPRFSGFLGIFQFLRVSFSFSFVSILAICHVLQCTFIIFLIIQCFLPYSSSYQVRFPFS